MSTPLNNQQLVVSYPQSNLVPNEGPKSIALLLDFTSSTLKSYTLDLENVTALAFISMIQTVYIDLSGSASNLTITFNNTGQVIVAKAHTQGYYQVLCPNPAKMQFDSAASGSIIPVQLLNVAISGVVWATQ